VLQNLVDEYLLMSSSAGDPVSAVEVDHIENITLQIRSQLSKRGSIKKQLWAQRNLIAWNGVVRRERPARPTRATMVSAMARKAIWETIATKKRGKKRNKPGAGQLGLR